MICVKCVRSYTKENRVGEKEWERSVLADCKGHWRTRVISCNINIESQHFPSACFIVSVDKCSQINLVIIAISRASTELWPMLLVSMVTTSKQHNIRNGFISSKSYCHLMNLHPWPQNDWIYLVNISFGHRPSFCRLTA